MHHKAFGGRAEPDDGELTALPCRPPSWINTVTIRPPVLKFSFQVGDV